LRDIRPEAALELVPDWFRNSAQKPLAGTISTPNPKNEKAPHLQGFNEDFGGELGIRTLETLLTFAGFQDRCIQPLCQFPFLAVLLRAP
jgi:hypothetical protein